MSQVVGAVVSSGKARAALLRSKAPLVYQWHGKNYYGAAHGVAGILYLLLQVTLPLSPSSLVIVVSGRESGVGVRACSLCRSPLNCAARVRVVRGELLRRCSRRGRHHFFTVEGNVE